MGNNNTNVKPCIILFGAGKRAAVILGLINNDDYSSIMIFDNNKQLWGEFILGYEILEPFKPRKEMYWCVTIKDETAKQSVRRQCIEDMGFCVDNEVGYYDLIVHAYRKLLLNTRKLTKANERIVLFEFLPGFALGGIETWTVGLTKALKEKTNWKPILISKRTGGSVPSDIKKNIIYVDDSTGLRFQLEFMDELAKRIIESKPRSIVVSRPNEVALLACQIKKHTYPQMRIYIVIHSDICDMYDYYSALWNAYGNIDFYIGVSDDVARRIKEKGVPEERILSMTCPFNCEENMERTYSIEKNDPIQVGYAGRLDGFKGSQKRMDLLIELCTRLNRAGVNFNLNVAGEGPAKEKMIEYSKKNSIWDNIDFLGGLSQEEIEVFWRRQDIAVNVADYEGRCISKLEAMANGAVPIMTDTAGNRQDIYDGENGYVVPLGDVDAIVEHIMYLEKHRELLPIMGGRAHDCVYPKSSMDNHVAFWDALFSGKQIANENRL